MHLCVFGLIKRDVTRRKRERERWKGGEKERERWKKSKGECNICDPMGEVLDVERRRSFFLSLYRLSFRSLYSCKSRKDVQVVSVPFTPSSVHILFDPGLIQY